MCICIYVCIRICACTYEDGGGRCQEVGLEVLAGRASAGREGGRSGVECVGLTCVCICVYVYM